jgi:hypothetical protein
MSTQLTSAIEVVYSAFCPVARPVKIDGCRCCIDDREVYVMMNKPLRELSAAELSSYASSVFLTVGSAADYRYYLPRIVEHVANVDGWWPGPELLGRSLACAGWTKWSEDERGAVAGFFEAILRHHARLRAGYDIGDWLCGIAAAGVDMAPFMKILWEDPEAAVALFRVNAASLAGGGLQNGFWSENPAGMKQVVAWFYSDEVGIRILEECGVDLALPNIDSKL